MSGTAQLFHKAVEQALRTLREPFLVHDIRIDVRELTGPEKTKAWHVVRDLVDDGELRHDNQGYWRV